MALPATLRCTAVNLILLRMQHTDRSGHQHEESKNHRDHQPLFYDFFAKKTAATMLSTVMVLRVTQISASANRTIKMPDEGYTGDCESGQADDAQYALGARRTGQPFTCVASINLSPYLVASTMVTTTKPRNGAKKTRSLHSRLNGIQLILAGSIDSCNTRDGDLRWRGFKSKTKEPGTHQITPLARCPCNLSVIQSAKSQLILLNRSLKLERYAGIAGVATGDTTRYLCYEIGTGE